MLLSTQNRARTLNIFQVLVFMASSSSMALGQPAVMESSSSSSSSESTTEVKKFAPKFRQRLKDIKEQINTGVTKGWITQDQADQLKKQHDEVAAFEVEVRSKGYPRKQEDQLEQQVTELNQSVQSAIAKSSASKEPQPSKSESEAK